MNKMLGVTLIELIVAIIIGMILMSLGTLSLRGFMIDNAIDNASGDFFNAVHSARSQAIALGSTVTLCYANSSKSCVSSNGQQLQMFIDTDNDGVLKTTATAEVSLMNSLQARPIHLSITSNQQLLRFSPDAIIVQCRDHHDLL